jgi:NTE family protein
VLELAAQTYPATDRQVPLIDRVKVVSSVSGGSVVAAWFGLVGPARLDELKSDFLAQDNMATLEWEAADPLTLARLSLSSSTRIDALRDLLDRELFHGARFADLRRLGAPLAVMNATDMESGEVFAFTPQRFDDLCSDLDQLLISVAVAASAAFPVALSPMSLRNYKGAVPGSGWISAELSLPLPRYINLEEYKRARYANALRNGKDAYRNEYYLHLLDGGLVDNKAAGASTVRAPGQPLFAGLRVYNISVNFDQFLPEQRQLQIAVKNIGTSWSPSPTQLQEAIEAGRILLRQHPCFQRPLLDLDARPGPPELAIVRKSCPFEDDKTSYKTS